MPSRQTSPSVKEIVRTLFIMNKSLFGGFALMLIIGIVTNFCLNKGELLEFFSENRHPAWDLFFRYITKTGEEGTYILSIFLFLLFKRRPEALMVPLTGLLVTLVSFLSKQFFQQPRPHEYYKQLGKLAEINPVEGVSMVKGFSSFPSGHTMSAFALLMLIAFYSSKEKWRFILFVAALLVGISRVYLAQHFLEDILLGAFMGLPIAMMVFIGQQKYLPKWKGPGRFTTT